MGQGSAARGAVSWRCRFRKTWWTFKKRADRQRKLQRHDSPDLERRKALSSGWFWAFLLLPRLGCLVQTAFVCRASLRSPFAEPAWLKHDRQVLCFFCYTREGFAADGGGGVRNCAADGMPDGAGTYEALIGTLPRGFIRCCCLYYYLQDGTLQVFEPKTPNSGRLQGAFLKRHTPPRSNGQGFVDLSDLKVRVLKQRLPRVGTRGTADAASLLFGGASVGKEPRALPTGLPHRRLRRLY